MKHVRIANDAHTTTKGNDMKTFMLLLTIYHNDAPPDVYVIDHALTAEQCTTMMYDYHTDNERHTVSCEFDHAPQS